VRIILALAVLLASGLGIAPAFSAAAGRPARPERVVSLNLCADQYLLALADRAQIASLSPLSRDPEYSFLAGRAGDLPVNGGTGEEILVDEADLVLSGRYGTRVKREMLQRHGVPMMVLDPWRDVAEGREQLLAVAARLGHPERGDALVREIDAALARTKGIARRPATVLILHRRGYVPGERSLVAELLRHMGLTPMQARLGLPLGGLVRLEQLVMDPPDFVVMDEDDARAIDNGTAFRVHPALAQLLPPERRLFLSDRLTICGGPSTPAAIDALAAEVRAKVNGER
jgi:iron complex transport system substrate-binding protein